MTLPREKIVRDPVYGNISIPWPFLLDLIDSPEFQRLRNIRQLGLCFTTFHGAEHSRFQHAIGVMWLMFRVLDRWHQNRLAPFTEQERKAACAAALLHDIGHGPFSHALERAFSQVDHETLGRKIVRERLAPILEAHEVPADTVVSIMNGDYRHPVLSELLASQLDVDRMDYLQRDSLYTGVKYGLFDSERILHTLVPIEQTEWVLGVELKGVPAVEEFLFSRYFMHWQVYLHRTVRAAETMLRLILERAAEVYPDLEVPSTMRFLFEPGDNFLDNFLNLDDFDFFHTLKLWRAARDPLLSDLCQRLVGRRLFKVLPHPGAGSRLDQVHELVRRTMGPNWEYYVREDALGGSSFGVYRPSRHSPIRALLDTSSNWREISEVTRSPAILSLSERANNGFLVICEECRKEAAEILDPGLEFELEQLTLDF